MTDANNNPRTGTFTFKFSIYNSLTGGTQLWPAAGTEDQVVTVTNGVFSVVLGAVSPITTSVFNGQTAYIDLTVDADNLTPRQRLLSVPYAFSSEMFNGYTGSYYVSTAPVAQTISGVKTFTSFPTMNLSTMVPSSNGELVTKIYADTGYLASSRTWSATQTFEDFPLKTGGLTPTNNGDLVTKNYADTAYLASTRTWSATQTFEDFPVKTGSLTPSSAGELVTKSYADSGYLAAERTFTANQTFTKTLSVSGTSFFVGTDVGVGISTPTGDASTNKGDITIAGTSFFGAAGSYYVKNTGLTSLGVESTGNREFTTPAAADAFITLVNWTGGVATNKLYFTTTSALAANAMMSIGGSGILRTRGAMQASVNPDISEYIQAAPDVEANDVVSVSHEPGGVEGYWGERVKVKRSHKPYDDAILGVIAAGESSFIAGGGYAEISSGKVRGGAKPIVLAGRVPVKVCAENGPVQIGDYLTSSSKPGYAMKATRPGPTVGIALENFPAEGPAAAQEGKVLCFVKIGERNISLYGEEIKGLEEKQRELHEKIDALEKRMRGK